MQIFNQIKRIKWIYLPDTTTVIGITQHYYQPAEINTCKNYSACIRCKNQSCIKFKRNEIQLNAIEGFAQDHSLQVCPVNAISWDYEKNEPVIDQKKCFNCGLCAVRCPVGAIYYDENHNKTSINLKNPSYHFLPVTEENLRKQALFLRNCRETGFDRHYRVESEASLNTIISFLTRFDGRSNVPDLLTRNVFLCLGNQCAITRQGDTNNRIDAIYALNSNPEILGAIEMEFKSDSLSAVRGLLDDIAELQVKYSIPKENNYAVTVFLKLPNKRQGYYQVIKDIKNVVGLRLQTVSIGMLLILLWNGCNINLSDRNFYLDFDNLSLKTALEEQLRRVPNISDNDLGILSPEK